MAPSIWHITETCSSDHAQLFMVGAVNRVFCSCQLYLTASWGKHCDTMLLQLFLHLFLKNMIMLDHSLGCPKQTGASLCCRWNPWKIRIGGNPSRASFKGLHSIKLTSELPVIQDQGLNGESALPHQWEAAVCAISKVVLMCTGQQIQATYSKREVVWF